MKKKSQTRNTSREALNNNTEVTIIKEVNSSIQKNKISNQNIKNTKFIENNKNK